MSTQVKVTYEVFHKRITPCQQKLSSARRFVLSVEITTNLAVRVQGAQLQEEESGDNHFR